MEIVKFDRVFDAGQIPAVYEKHIAFSGKSNVGKSSLLNTLFNRKKLAPTSSRPGKTRGLNLYIANGRFILCDLPGYGYAAFSKAQREQFLLLSAEYFRAFADRLFLFVLIDIRRDVSELDVSLLNYCSEYSIPFGLVLTKTDKISKNKQISRQAVIKKQLSLYKIKTDHVFPVSVREKNGISDLSNFLLNLLSR